MTIDHDREVRELEQNRKSLEETKKNLEKMITMKGVTIEKANQVRKF